MLYSSLNHNLNALCLSSYQTNRDSRFDCYEVFQMYQISVKKLPIEERHSCQKQTTHSSGCVGIWSIDFTPSTLLFIKILICHFEIQFVQSGNQEAIFWILSLVKSDFFFSSKYLSNGTELISSFQSQ